MKKLFNKIGNQMEQVLNSIDPLTYNLSFMGGPISSPIVGSIGAYETCTAKDPETRKTAWECVKLNSAFIAANAGIAVATNSGIVGYLTSSCLIGGALIMAQGVPFLMSCTRD